MRMLKLRTLMGLMAGLLAAHSTFAQAPPALINYQGRLFDAEGKALVGPTNVTVNIYDSATGGTRIWGPQTFNNQSLVDGYFNVILNTDSSSRSVSTAVTGTGTSPRYLDVSATGLAETLPRQRLLSAPYALVAESARNAGVSEGWALAPGLNDPAAIGKILEKKKGDSFLSLAVDTMGLEGKLFRGVYLGNTRLQITGKASVFTGLVPGTEYFISPDSSKAGELITSADQLAHRETATLAGVAVDSKTLLLVMAPQTVFNYSAYNLPSNNLLQNPGFDNEINTLASTVSVWVRLDNSLISTAYMLPRDQTQICGKDSTLTLQGFGIKQTISIPPEYYGLVDAGEATASLGFIVSGNGGIIGLPIKLEAQDGSGGALTPAPLDEAYSVISGGCRTISRLIDLKANTRQLTFMIGPNSGAIPTLDETYLIIDRKR